MWDESDTELETNVDYMFLDQVSINEADYSALLNMEVETTSYITPQSFADLYLWLRADDITWITDGDDIEPSAGDAGGGG